jgi:acyl-CoA synthetase (NDP forming)
MLNHRMGNKHNHWQYFFAPDSVAVVGASNSPGSWGHGIMRHLLATATSAKRKVYPVNPSAPEVLGVPAYDSVLNIPGPVELAIIVVSAHRVPALMRECVQKGVKAAIVISGGFAESGEQGSKLEAELVRVAKEGGIPFIGPNSMGHADTSAQVCTLAWLGDITPGPVALISQSGNMGHRIIHNGMSSGFGFSKFISTGNEADLHLEDYLEYLAQDEKTRVITAYIEGLRQGRRFFQLAKETTINKPIIVIKAGGTKESARAVRSHTATLAGSDAVYAAAFRQAGVMRVDDDDELCDLVTALLYQPLPRAARIGILTIGGGLGVMTAEAVEREGLEVAQLAQATIEKLGAYLPPRWSRSNPVDMAGISTAESPKIFSSLWALMEDDNIDAILLQAPIGLGPKQLSNMFNSEETRAFRETEEGNLNLLRQQVQKHGKPVFVVRPAVEFASDPEVSSLFHREEIPVYPSPRRAARVLNHLAWYRRYLDTN